MILSAIISIFASRKIAEPILELTEISRRMTNLDFNIKYHGKGENEIDQLGEHINQLSQTLESTISELKSANNELQIDIKKKTQIDEMRKEFLSNVSHELKTPLALIQGYAEGLSECVNEDASSREFYCEVIMDEADKMNQMVKKLLTLNQLEFGNDMVVMERFDLTELILGVIQSSSILLEQKRIHLTFHTDQSMYVWADEFKVEEVMTNYLSNAIHHTEELGRIDIKYTQMEDYVRISVFNTGRQIPKEDLERIWIKFYKVDKARTREYGGSGIGLSIVKAIMDSFHRSCGVINHTDGVEFWFELDTKSN
jgi:signal transduction histidine kinase